MASASADTAYASRASTRKAVAAKSKNRSPNSRGVIAPSGGAGATPASAGLSGLLTAQAVLTLLTGTPPLEPGYVHGLNLPAPGAPVYARHPPRPGRGTCRAP
ncbi:hypothetical protein AB0L05_30020 [Nonomuraea pusilla]|uniref:hypothetical protein n=1 Tax=Nonomuraea pusilla TaxID=46177 RepID=UPI00332B650A